MARKGFVISISAGPNSQSSNVSVHGQEQHVISQAEAQTFHLGTDSELASAVEKYFGRGPHNAFLHSPTPLSGSASHIDLYKKYGWEEVNTVITANAEIVEVTSTPVAVRNQEFDNKSSQPTKFSASLSDSVVDSTSTSWNTGGEFTISQSISYDIKFLGSGVGGETGMSYSESWGKGGEEQKSVSIGSTTGVEMTLKPGQKFTAELSASHGVMKVRVHYNAYLKGDVAVNYNPTYKGHHFFALPVDAVLHSASLPNLIKSSEDIEINYYSNSKIIVKDGNSEILHSEYTGHDVRRATD